MKSNKIMFNLKKKLIANEPYFIAEMSANHGNDLNIALEIVNAAAASGADCLKVQTYTADSMTIDCDNEYFKINGGLWDGRNLYDLYSEGSLPWEWHLPIKERCDRLGIDFLSTPFDTTAVDYLIDMGCGALKIASFELIDLPLIEYAASTGKTLIMSTGMATLEEIEEAVSTARMTGNNDLILLRCCSEYPAMFSDMNLVTLSDMQKRFKCPIGFSDHSLGADADIIAVSLGACIIEKHFCLNRNLQTVDSPFSMEPEEYKKMVKKVKNAKQALGTVSYGPTSIELSNLIFRRSIMAIDRIETGDFFTIENVKVIRPGYGLKPKYFKNLLGKKAKNSYNLGDPISVDEI